MTSVKYGQGELSFTLELDPAALLRTAGLPSGADGASLPETPAAALAAPTDGTAPLAERLSPHRPVTVVVSDLTRAWIPTARLVGALSSVFVRLGVPDRQVTILVATGTHRPHTPAELTSLVGAEALARFTVLDHDCRATELVSFGSTVFGTPVALNPRVSGEAQVILTGGLSFHLMCGFGGGRKSICPGVAGYDTVQANHRLVLTDPQGAAPRPGALDGNLMHADLMETAARVNPLFLINALPPGADGAGRFVSGDWRGAWQEGCRRLEAESRVEVGEPADLIVAGAGGYPHDLNLYQTVKAVVHVQAGLRPGGTLVLASHCTEGLGGGPDFAEALAYGLVEAEQRLRERFTVPAYAAFRLRGLAERVRIILVSSLPPEVVGRAGLLPACSLDEAYALACDGLAPGHRTYLVPDASRVLLCRLPADRAG
ncbi:MAG: nickel-dependent lactate racemase [Chitinophagales bacterium]